MRWWAAVLVGMVTGPLLVTAAAGVRALVEQVLHRGGQEAEFASTAGLLSGSLCCALVAHEPKDLSGASSRPESAPGSQAAWPSGCCCPPPGPD